MAKQFKEKNWRGISKHFYKKSPLQCFSRYKRIRPGIEKGIWKKEEDNKIMELVNKYGKSWSKISKTFKSRNGKQIRDRYINVLDPSIIKTKFSVEEDKKLIQLFKKLGPKWATISQQFPHRTADMLKNRFHSSLKKRIDEVIIMTEDERSDLDPKERVSGEFNLSSIKNIYVSETTERCSSRRTSFSTNYPLTEEKTDEKTADEIPILSYHFHSEKSSLFDMESDHTNSLLKENLFYNEFDNNTNQQINWSFDDYFSI